MANTQLITYKYRVKDSYAKKLLRHARACNFVWNFLVDTQKQSRKWGKPRPTAFDFIKLTTGCAAELGLHSDTVSAICRQFVKSRNQSKKCPRYRGRKSLGWIPLIDRCMRLKGSCVVYKGVGYKYWKSREVNGKIVCGSFGCDNRRRWYINICCDVECVETNVSGSIGIDLGLKSFATLSDGEVIKNPAYFREYENKLAIAQRAGRKNRARAIHAKIENARKNFLHNQSTRLAKAYGTIVVGNVNSGALAKTRMAKSVLDAGWSSFRGMLAYKTRLRGGEYIEGDERYSTQVCSGCGSRTGPKGVSQLGVRNWVCSGCGSIHDRDHNAALNILSFAMERHRPVAEISAA